MVLNENVISELNQHGGFLELGCKFAILQNMSLKRMEFKGRSVSSHNT